MKLPKRLAAAVCAAALLAGCALPGTERAGVEELLRAPRLEGDYGEIQSALNQWLEESAQLKYPMNGELLSPFLMSDFDGDGQQDAAVLYSTADTPNICLAVLQKDAEGVWQVQDAVEGLTETVGHRPLCPPSGGGRQPDRGGLQRLPGGQLSGGVRLYGGQDPGHPGGALRPVPDRGHHRHRV